MIPRNITEGLKLGFGTRFTALINPHGQQWQDHSTPTCIPQTVLQPSPSACSGPVGVKKTESITKSSKEKQSHLYLCNHASSTLHSDLKCGHMNAISLSCYPYSCLQANHVTKYSSSNRLRCRCQTLVSVSLLSSSRSVHTAASVTSSSGQILLSSRRGRLSSLEDAKHYVSSLSAYQQRTLRRALGEIDVNKESGVVHEGQVEAPTGHQLKLLCYQSALPFIGFGFLDNVIMITVGEYIDWTLGLTFGLSTMAAAGIGNMISDLAGLGMADQVEAICLRLGIPNPRLSSSQLRHKSSRWISLLGRCIGIVIGCTIGMAPLYWIKSPHASHGSNGSHGGSEGDK